MAPEILDNQPYNPKIEDIFGSAIVLFMMIMGHPPFLFASDQDKYYKWIINGKIDEFWELHHSKFSSPRSKNYEIFKDLFIKMITPDPEDRLTIEEIKQHEWFTACRIEEKDLEASMKLRWKVAVKIWEETDENDTEKSLFHHLKIPNDDEVQVFPQRSLKRGLQMKKYSECFRFITCEDLLSAIISFAKMQGKSYEEDSKMSTIIFESNIDDVNVSIKANVVNNPSTHLQCIQWTKLKGDKTPFMKVFSLLCQYCRSLDIKLQE